MAALQMQFPHSSPPRLLQRFSSCEEKFTGVRELIADCSAVIRWSMGESPHKSYYLFNAVFRMFAFPPQFGENLNHQRIDLRVDLSALDCIHKKKTYYTIVLNRMSLNQKKNKDFFLCWVIQYPRDCNHCMHVAFFISDSTTTTSSV